jgi:calcineurin-like phosphoesterase family protein
MWFTSDYHLYHANVLRFDERPFETVEEMNHAIRDRHNAVVAPDDIVFNLGDAVHRYEGKAEPLREFLRGFNGDYRYILGNHEKKIHQISQVWKVEGNLIDLYVKDIDQWIVLCHYGLRSWNRSHHGSWLLYGHSHGGLKNDNGINLGDDTRWSCLDVGCMNNDYRPFSLEEVQNHMESRHFEPNDHHTIRPLNQS